MIHRTDICHRSGDFSFSGWEYVCFKLVLHPAMNTRYLFFHLQHDVDAVLRWGDQHCHKDKLFEICQHSVSFFLAAYVSVVVELMGMSYILATKQEASTFCTQTFAVLLPLYIK